MVVALHHRGAGLDRRLGADVAMTDGAVVDVPGDESARIITVDRPDVLTVETDVPDPRGRLREGDAYVEPWLHHVGLNFRGPGWEDTGHRASGAARGTGTPPRVLGDAASKTLPGHNADHRMKSWASQSSTATQEATQPRGRVSRWAIPLLTPGRQRSYRRDDRAQCGMSGNSNVGSDFTQCA